MEENPGIFWWIAGGMSSFGRATQQPRASRAIRSPFSHPIPRRHGEGWRGGQPALSSGLIPPRALTFPIRLRKGDRGGGFSCEIPP